VAYFAPYIDESGLHIPTYTDIRDSLIDSTKQIFGQDIYLGADSQDYQWITTVANKINDTNQLLQLVYNSRSPITAIGTGLDAVVKINGIKKKTATYSTCPVILSGTAGTVINNGIVADVNNINYNLPSSVTIDVGGTVEAIATCQIPGPIVANPGEINQIVTPTYGWDSVTNNDAATVGSNAETDAQLRARQAVSTAQPSRTVLEGTKGAIASVIGVTRFKVYENDTSVADTNGIPANSICAVVENGNDSDIANALFYKKGPGCGTYGDVIVNIADSLGNLTPIKFYRPTYIDIDVTINVKALTGYTTQTTVDIKQAIVDYINSLQIGDDLESSILWGAALGIMPNLKAPQFSITSLTAGKRGEAQSTNPVAIAFKEVTRGETAYITVNVV
jgi:uncharacterized phage protein gp47/JayE